MVIFIHPVRNAYLSILADNNADIFAASLLISYCSFSSLILSLLLVIRFYIFSKRFFLKRKALSNARVVSISKNEHAFALLFVKRFITSGNSVSDEWLNPIC